MTRPFAPAHAHVPPGTRFYVIRLAKGYVVCDPDDRIVSEPFPFKLQADQCRDDRQKAADAKAKRGPRPCMRCDRVFDSEGIHHRLCGVCRHAADPLDPVRPFIDRRGP